MERLTAFVHGTRFEQLPPEVVEKAKAHTLDTLGAALAGSTAQEALHTRNALLATEGPGPAICWGTQVSFSPRQAALANGVAAHAFELDDTGGCDHSGAVVLPALIALLPTIGHPVSGRDLLAAIVVGYDVGRRVLEGFGGYRPHNEAGWHSTGTCGVFGAAAAAANLLRLDAAQTQACLGIAGSFSSGLWAFIHDGSMTKKLHAGRAAEGGVLAALLARSGMTGPTRLFDPVWGGFFKTYAHAPLDVQALEQNLGRDWRIMNAAIKPHASCRDTHCAVDAIDRILRRHPLKAGEVMGVQIRLNSFLASMVGGKDVSTLPAAQMSLPYAIAARICFGTAGLSAYTVQRRTSPEIAQMLQRIDIKLDDAVKASHETAVVLNAGGTSIEEPTSIPLGAPANPVPPDMLRAKYDELAALALPVAKAAQLADLVMGIDQVREVIGIAALLRAEQSRQP
jgi:2-methylcitrate dehydratase PrpD